MPDVNRAKPRVAGKSAFDWNVYSNRRTALQYLKDNCILVDTIIETEDGRAHELVHSQVMSAFGDKLTEFIARNGVPIIRLDNGIHNTTSNNIMNYGQHHQLTYHANNNNNNSGGSKHNANKDAAANKLKLVRPPKLNRYTLSILVECAYSGYIRTDLSSGGIWQVLDMADHYEMADVQRACCAFLIKNLNQSNCVHFYHIGIKHRHALQRHAWHQIRANFKSILAENLRQLAASERDQSAPMALATTPPASASAAAPPPPPPPPLAIATIEPTNSHRPIAVAGMTALNQATTTASSNNIALDNNLATIKYEHFEPLLMHDKLNVDNEESVWSAIKLWCQHDLTRRQQQVASLLACIRFPRLRASAEFSTRHIWRDPLIVNNKQAQHQLAVLDRNQRDFLSGLSRYTSAATGSGMMRDGFNLPCAVNPRQFRPRIPHSILLAIGGWQQGQPTTLIESYDVNCNIWFECRHKITSSLAYHGIECIEGRLYICGGTDGRDILNHVSMFDPVSGQSTILKSMHEDRCYVSTAHLDGFMYAMGGHNGHQRLKSAERYNVSSNSWQYVADMNVTRSDASACVHRSLIFIAGGLNDQVIESSVEFYSAANNTWTFVCSMAVPRTSFTLLRYRDSLLAVGGNNGIERLNSVEQYNFATNTWRDHSQMRHRRSTFSAALIDDSKLFVVGGYNGQTPFAQVEMYDERSNQWLQMQKIRYDRSGLKLVVVKDLPNAMEYTFLGCPSNSCEYSVQESSSPR